MAVTCSQCRRTFVSNDALIDHCVAKTDHYFCDDCERLFVSDKVLQYHLATVHQDDSDGSESDSEDSDEAYCARCKRYFVNEDALEQHIRDAPVHDTESEKSEESDDSEDNDVAHCASCKRTFVSKAALHQHLITSSAHHWCFPCSKDFPSTLSLSEHNASRVHTATALPDVSGAPQAANHTCPLCPRVFTAPSSIADHIEKGGCHLQITRHHVTAAVHALKVHPDISIAGRVEGPPPTAVIVTYSATELAFNRQTGEYECYICHRGFGMLASLNTHLASAAHDATQFKCPHTPCGREFTLISALIQHIESEACGLAKFRIVEDFAHSLRSQFTKMFL